MKFTPADQCKLACLELTRRNLTTLLAKLDDELSACTLIDGDHQIAVKAVEGASPMVDNGVGGFMDETARIIVTPVEDAEHYSDRPPGQIFMPSTGETL